MIELDRIQEEIGAWSKKNFGHEGKTHHPLLGVAEEVGELCHAHLKQEQGIRGTKEEHEADAIDAIGDIAIYLMDYCNRRGFSFNDIVWQTWSKVKERDWNKDRIKGGETSNG